MAPLLPFSVTFVNNRRQVLLPPLRAVGVCSGRELQVKKITHNARRNGQVARQAALAEDDRAVKNKRAAAGQELPPC